MKSHNLKHQTAISIFWSFVEKGGQQFLALVVGIVLGRILFPKDFGLIGILMIFSSLANILQDGAFSAALIRKKEPTQNDYATAFWFNIVISITIYLILYSVAPFIALYYNQPLLSELARILFLSFLFNAPGLVQNVQIIKQLNFKKNAIINFVSVIISGGIAVLMAVYGYGVWSLVVQMVIMSVCRTSLLWIFGKWKPIFIFSRDSFIELFPFSVKLLVTNIINQLCAGIYPNVIAKSFSLVQTGFYTQALKFQTISIETIANSIQQVSFPVLSNISDDSERLRRVFAKLLRLSAFLSFPLLLSLVVVAKPMIIALLSSKWEESSVFLQLLCFSGLFYPLTMVNNVILKAKGEAGTILHLEILRNVLSIISLLITIHWGINALILGISIVNFFNYLLTGYFAGRFIRYSLWLQLKDIYPYLIIAFSICTFVYFWNPLVENVWGTFFLQVFFCLILYIITAGFLGSKIIGDIIKLSKNNKI